MKLTPGCLSRSAITPAQRRVPIDQERLVDFRLVALHVAELRLAERRHIARTPIGHEGVKLGGALVEVVQGALQILHLHLGRQVGQEVQLALTRLEGLQRLAVGMSVGLQHAVDAALRIESCRDDGGQADGERREPGLHGFEHHLAALGAQGRGHLRKAGKVLGGDLGGEGMGPVHAEPLQQVLNLAGFVVGDLEPQVLGALEGGVDLRRTPGRVLAQHVHGAEQVDGGVAAAHLPQGRLRQGWARRKQKRQKAERQAVEGSAHRRSALALEGEQVNASDHALGSL